MVHLSLRRPILGGIVFAIILTISSLTFIEMTGILARELLENSVSGIISLCYVISIGSIYILVIILHLLSARLPMEMGLRHKHYNSLLSIAKLATLLIIFSIVVILLLNIPFTRLRAIPDALYSTIYYIILAIASILGGSFISIITMIYITIRTMIHQEDGQLSLNLNSTEDSGTTGENNVVPEEDQEIKVNEEVKEV
ncbi:hypothetical protein FK178_04060 [Antarcticibacterium arcticum]|uniref:Uncharacterized protein n=1 Tax=Antarcticibacterium arcticum TaxID=2585771 RepID=A0A5B8YJC0_9FLAO|nr:hypothetical protein [Antarcticibacterium arcticum]QED36937.1 hypothetical protein FK178_04060 [Antarcticibacterium arcticum]